MIRKLLYRIDKVLSFFEHWTLFIAVTAALSTLFVSVITRFLTRWGISSTLTWPEELVREVIVYTTFVGCAAAVKNRALIRIDALPSVVQGLKRPLDILSHFALMGFSVFITYYGFQMALFQHRMGMKTIILQIPQWVVYSVLPLMGVIMFFRLLHVIYEDVTGNKVAEAGQDG